MLYSRLGRFAVIVLLSLISVSHAIEATNRVTVIRVSGGGHPLKAQLGADGTIHLLLDSTNGPLYMKSQDGGVSFIDPVAVVDAAAQKPGLKFDGADLAVSREGRVRFHGSACAIGPRNEASRSSIAREGLRPGFVTLG